jgi:paraquat-inducible protein B
MGKRVNPAVIGAFVVGAIVLATVTVAVLGSGRFFRVTYPFVLFFTGDVNGLKEGAPVKFKGVEVGTVTKIMLNVSDVAPAKQGTEAVRIPVIIELDPEHIGARGGHVRLDQPQAVKELIERGLRGQLATESFVTGVLYVKLDLMPDKPAIFVADPTVPYPEIPTVPTPLEQLQMYAEKLADRLKEIDIQGLVSSLEHVAKGVDRLVNSPGVTETVDRLPQTLKTVDAAFAQMTTTLTSVDKLSNDARAHLGPAAASVQTASLDLAETLQAAKTSLDEVTALLNVSSPLVIEAQQAMTDASAAAFAIRRFAEELERNPSVVLRGKAVVEESNK